MLVVERRARILESLRDARIVSTDLLAQRLAVSAETIRRDLATMEREGLLARVHGGAAVPAAAGSGEESSFADRATSAPDAKARIGRAAAGLVRPGQTVFLDVGTTALSVARALPADFRGTVATCSLLAAAELADRPHLEILVSGGRLRRGDLALSDSVAQAFFADLYPDVAFLGSGGIDAEAGLTDYYLEEAATRRIVLKNAAASYVLADSTKMGRRARHRVAPLGDFAGLITEADPPREIREAIEGSGGSVLVAAASLRGAAAGSRSGTSPAAPASVAPGRGGAEADRVARHGAAT